MKRGMYGGHWALSAGLRAVSSLREYSSTGVAEKPRPPAAHAASSDMRAGGRGGGAGFCSNGLR